LVDIIQKQLHLQFLKILSSMTLTLPVFTMQGGKDRDGRGQLVTNPCPHPMYPHLVTSQKAGMCYSVLVVGRAIVVDRVQTFDCEARQNKDLERLFSLRPE
jgi:hypothetical protein